MDGDKSNRSYQDPGPLLPSAVEPTSVILSPPTFHRVVTTNLSLSQWHQTRVIEASAPQILPRVFISKTNFVDFGSHTRYTIKDMPHALVVISLNDPLLDRMHPKRLSSPKRQKMTRELKILPKMDSMNFNLAPSGRQSATPLCR